MIRVRMSPMIIRIRTNPMIQSTTRVERAMILIKLSFSLPRRFSRVTRLNPKLLDDPRYTKKGGVLHDHVLVRNEDIEVEISSQEDLALAVSKIIEAECYAVLLEGAKNPRPDPPIPDLDTKDPSTIEEARHSLYWGEFLGSIIEEYEGLEAKEVYEEVDSLPPG